MSKLLQKHVTNQWLESCDMLEAKKIKVLNIIVVTPIGESQAGHKKQSCLTLILVVLL